MGVLDCQFVYHQPTSNYAIVSDICSTEFPYFVHGKSFKSLFWAENGRIVYDGFASVNGPKVGDDDDDDDDALSGYLQNGSLASV